MFSVRWLAVPWFAQQIHSWFPNLKSEEVLGGGWMPLALLPPLTLPCVFDCSLSLSLPVTFPYLSPFRPRTPSPAWDPPPCWSSFPTPDCMPPLAFPLHVFSVSLNCFNTIPCKFIAKGFNIGFVQFSFQKWLKEKCLGPGMWPQALNFMNLCKNPRILDFHETICFPCSF